MKKMIALLLTLVMVAGLAVGCDSQKEDTVPQGEGSGLKGTMDIFQFKVEINDALRAAADRYMELNPGVTINLETVGGGDDYGAALRTKMQGSEQPDIFNVVGPQEVLDWSEYLADLTQEPWVPNTVDGLLNDVTREDKVYAMPFAIEGYGFIYNKRIFEAAGIDATKLKTFDEIDAAFSQLKAKIDAGELKDQFPMLEAVIEYPAKEKWVTGMHTGNIAFGQEFASCTDAFNAETINFNYSSQLKDLIDLQVKYTTNAENPGALNAVDYSMQAGGGIAIERVAVIQQGNWVYPIIAEIDEEVAQNLGIIPMPLKGISEGNIPVGVPMYWAVNSKSDEASQAIAKDFLNWLYQSEEGKKLIVSEFGFIPPFTNYGEFLPTDPLGQAVNAAANAGNVAPWVFGGCPTSWAENVFGSEIQAYLAGEKTWDDAVASAQAQWADARK